MIEDNMKYVLSLNSPLSSGDGIISDVADVLKQKENISVGNLIKNFLGTYNGSSDEMNIKNTLESSIEEAETDPEKKFLSVKAIDPDSGTYRKIDDTNDVYTDLINPQSKALDLFETYKEFSETFNKEMPYKGLYLDVCADFTEGR